MSEKTNKHKRFQRDRRHTRVRARIEGTAARPRLNVYRSLANIYAQVIDDEAGHTLVSASTIDADVQTQANGKNKKDAAKIVGKIVAERAKAAGITQVSSTVVGIVIMVASRRLLKAPVKPASNSRRIGGTHG